MMVKKNAFLLLFILTTCLFSTVGCISYQRYPLPKQRLAIVDKTPLTFYLLDAAHPLTRVWYVSEYEFRSESVQCFATKMAEIEAKEIYNIKNRADAKYSKDDALIFVDPKYAMTIKDTATLEIPFSQIKKIEVYEVNYSKTMGTTLLALGGVIVMFNWFD